MGQVAHGAWRNTVESSVAGEINKACRNWKEETPVSTGIGWRSCTAKLAHGSRGQGGEVRRVFL